MKIKAYDIKIKGNVTGVCFRAYTLCEAEKYPGLQGYVRNVFHGEVEVVLQGEEYNVKNMITWLHHGPSHARVDSIKINEIPISTTLPSFKIAY